MEKVEGAASRQPRGRDGVPGANGGAEAPGLVVRMVAGWVTPPATGRENRSGGGKPAHHGSRRQQRPSAATVEAAARGASPPAAMRQGT